MQRVHKSSCTFRQVVSSLFTPQFSCCCFFEISVSYKYVGALRSVLALPIQLSKHITIEELSHLMSLGMMIRFLLLRCFTLSFIIASASTSSITTDWDALLAYKSHITHDPTNFLAKNWSTSTSVCNWTGVTCDVYNHRVTALNISLFGLTGTIPIQLGNLSSLQPLNLSHNRLSGAIPSSIFSINSLQILDLSDNQLSGSFPSSISNMSSLTFIDFSSNTLSDQLSPNICNHFPNLESLLLKNNTFYGKIPSTLSNCRQLRKLYLSLNKFTGAIPKEIGKLTRLSVLSLRDNKFQGTIKEFN